MTICTQCVHFRNLEPGSPREDCWYNHLCLAVRLPKGMDPYDGKLKPYRHNDLGKKYFADEEYEYCERINDGNCKFFAPASLAKRGQRTLRSLARRFVD